MGWFLLISDKRKVTQVLLKAHNSLASKELNCFFLLGSVIYRVTDCPSTADLVVCHSLICGIINQRRINMGLVYEEITLKNAADVTNARRVIINKPEIRQATITAMVDTGAGTLIINEAIRQRLGLDVIAEKSATLANDIKEMCGITEPVEIHWNNRFTAVSAFVVSGNGDVLLGAIPLEGLDLMVDPTRRKLVGAHGDEAVYIIK
jgi:clan AA aspartic protease